LERNMAGEIKRKKFTLEEDCRRFSKQDAG
jgi:hypothetical protein